MLNCQDCKWSNPETCRICRIEEKEKELDKLVTIPVICKYIPDVRD